VVDGEGRKNPWAPFADRIATLYSQDALDGSNKTRKQSRKHEDIRYDDLITRGSTFQENLIPPEKRWQAFKERRKEGWRNLRNLRKQRELMELRLAHFRALLQLAHQEEMQVYLMISPYHEALLDHLVQSGNWSTFEWWKRRLVELNEQVAKEAGRPVFPLWDFSGYHEIALDPPPSDEHPKHIMQYYVECSHYRKRVGDWMISTVLRNRVVREGFGQRLESGDLEGVLEQQRHAMERQQSKSDRS